ncbi:MAG TPA: type II secretion system F family protein [Elusimicrobiales bacterium]|nr:type II secretion system F family protein [Elusimicrobiales bacterium]
MKQQNKIFIITTCILVLCKCQIFANVFTKSQVDTINCSISKMQVLYYYPSDKRNDSRIKTGTFKCLGKEFTLESPDWLDEVVPSMLENKVWRDPATGTLTEAQIWQMVFAAVYAFLELNTKSFTKEEGGAGIPPSFLVKEYSDLNSRLEVAIDRLYRARLADSMQGRGRSLMATLTLMFRQFDSIMIAISREDNKQFARSAVVFSDLSQNAFAQMFKKPRQDKKLRKVTKIETLFPVFLSMIAVAAFFMSVFFYFGKKGKGFQKVSTDFIEKFKKWTEDFNRQFLKVKVEFLVFVPIIFCSLLGVLTASILGFFIFFAIGVFIGLKTPKFILELLKNRRGKKTDTQLMDGLILLSNSLKSGMDIVEGFKMVSQDLSPPISEEFGLVLKNYQLGTPFEKALEGLNDRVDSQLVDYFVKAIILQRQVGGNLTKIFSRIVSNIREESKFQDKTKALTAQQKIQSVVVGIMPWILTGIMFMFQKEAMIRFYTTFIGLVVLVFCVFWLIMGMLLANKIGKVRV